MDGRRHSVDIPMSRTLGALRRVRSLRDPSTNSLSNFSPLIDNLNWETNSNAGITLGFENKNKEGYGAGDDVVGIRDKSFVGLKEQCCNEREFYYNSRKSNYAHEISGYIGNIHIEGTNMGQSGQDMLCGSKSMSERYCSNYRDKGLELAYVTPFGDYQEGAGSCNEANDALTQERKIDYHASDIRCHYRKHTRSSKAAAGDVLSRIGSPCLSRSEAVLGGSSLGISLYGNEDADILDSGQCGCGITRYWSRTPRLRESSLCLDVEEQPLLGGNGNESLPSGKRRSCNINNEVALYSESPKSLSQKFRPRSFDELIGQSVVSRSLLTAISNGRITSFYLFHGPRGTGKTSASRIFAAALNCISPDIDKPCGLCQECVLFFSGRSRTVKEIDPLKVNKTQRIRTIIKNAENSPVSSRFRVFIVDECHLLQEDTWATFLNNLESLSRHVVFIMITPDLHKLPRSAVSRSQRYHFPKIKEVDITRRLDKICMVEGFEFDQEALEFIGAKSNGSLRDAEMMLEQFSLIGKRITMSLVYELMGVVSDDELLDLLRLALSSDTPETVKRARELMRSRIDPLQLITQLANLIMDILAGKGEEDTSEFKRRFHGKYTSEAEFQQLSHALKILSETEKQLRMSKNQTTWLTVALLQLNSVSPSLDSNESRLCMKTAHTKDSDFCSTSSTNETLKYQVTCSCDCNDPCKMAMQNRQQTLESIWRRAAIMCESSSLKNVLHKHGKLMSVSLKQGLALAELGFHHPKYLSKAENSWKVIASALQQVLGHNVEIRIHLIESTSPKDKGKWKKPSFSLFGCSRRICYGSKSTPESVSEPSDNSDLNSGKASTRDKHVELCSSECGSHVSHTCCNGKEVIRAIRNKDGNALSIAMTTTPHRVLKSHQFGADQLEEDRRNYACQDLTPLEPEKQPGCFARMVKLRKSNASKMIFLEKNAQNSLALSVPCTRSSEIHFNASDPVIVSCSRSDISRNCCRNDTALGS